MRPITPWTHYLIAGVIAAGMFVLVHGTAMMLRSIGEVAPAAIPQTPQPGFFDILPWAVSPFFLAVAICWLARLPHWPRIVGVSGGSAERIFDGLAICLVMLLAQVTALSLHLGLETSFGVMLKTRLAESGGNTLLFLLRPTNPSLLLGFLVGAVVVKDVRRAAHSQLTDSKALHEYARSEELARERQELIGPAEIRRKLAQSGSI